MESLHRGFQESQQPAEAEATFRWLDRVDGHPQVQDLKRRMLDLCPVGADAQVLDVGCGLGHEVRRLAGLVGPGGRVVGVDRNAAMVAEARRRAAEEAVPIAFDVGDAQRLEYADDTFDLCRTERVLRYVEAPETAVREMARVACPGGSVVAFDFDSDQTVVDVADRRLAQLIADVLDAAVPNPWIGRRLFGLFQRAGLADVRVAPYGVFLAGSAGFAIYRQLNGGTIERAVAEGRIAADDVATWWAGLERAAKAEAFFSASLGFIVAGRKP